MFLLGYALLGLINSSIHLFGEVYLLGHRLLASCIWRVFVLWQKIGFCHLNSIVGSGFRSEQNVVQPKVTLVTPMAQALEITQSQLKREGKLIRGGHVGPPGERWKQ